MALARSWSSLSDILKRLASCSRVLVVAPNDVVREMKIFCSVSSDNVVNASARSKKRASERN